MLDRIIAYSFYLLFFLTPLFWTSLNHELFEFNKMLLIYAFTVIISGCWLLKAINDKQLTIKRTPLDIPLLIFLGANILSTIFSIDVHTSIWGYYSRSNGGLLSLVSYLLLYWAFASNMNFEKAKTMLKFGLASGTIIAIWAIFEHFGASFSCAILRGEFNASCWIQDVQARVFATLGQPNWLASYLAMLIFPAIYFFLTATKKSTRIAYYILLITMYLAFTFTYSRGPTLGLIGGMAVFLGFVLLHLGGVKAHLRGVLMILASFLIINLLFGSALTSFRLVSKFAAPVRPSLNITTVPASGTQLENGGTESGQIRLIVWRGALDIFKHYPIFGSGLETFAYSYYQYRPIEHNLTSEWDFLYNKAHNEFLNYLATTGIVGFGTYLLVIGTFIFWCISRIFNFQFSIFNKNFKLQISNFKTPVPLLLVIISLLASYISYLIANFFLFSVVITAVFFYLFPAIAFVASGSSRLITYPLSLIPYPKVSKGIVIFFTLYLLYSIFQLWYADTLFASGERASDTGNPGRAYNLLSVASELNKGEPYYRSELAYSAAQAAVALETSDATLSATLRNEAIANMELVLKENPKNVSYFRTAIRTYFELAVMDENYLDETLQILDQAISFAPTDPKLYYNKALILKALGKKDEKIKALEKTLELKPNYLEAIGQLKEATAAAK